MPAKPRSEIIDQSIPGIYHCYARLVRGQFLFGKDSLTGRDYNHRKFWLRDQFRELCCGNGRAGARLRHSR